MAVNLNNSPSATINVLSSAVSFQFTMTGIETGNIVRRFIYQLHFNGQPVGPMESLSPQEGVPFPLDVSKDVRDLIFTLPPSVGAQPDMIGNITLFYGELEYDKENCETLPFSLLEAGPYPVLNSVNQFYGYYDGGAGLDHIPLTPKPNVFTISPDMEDYYYAWTAGSTALIHQLYAKDGNVMKVQNGALGPGPASFKLDWSGPYFGGKTIRDLSHSILTLGGEQVCRYVVDRCNEAEHFYFQSYGGGYQLMWMTPTERLMTTSAKEVCRYQPTVPQITTPYSSAILHRKGVSIADKESYRTKKFSKVLNNYDEESLRYYEDFLGSGSYYYLSPTRQGNAETTALVKFIPETGSLKYHEEDDIYVLEFTGKINQPHQMPNYAI